MMGRFRLGFLTSHPPLTTVNNGFRGVQLTISCSMWPHEVFEMMAFAMNTTHAQETGKSLETSVEDLKMFFGISLTMSSLCYQQIRMYWMKKTRVPLVAHNMTKNRYFQLRCWLKLVNELDVSEQEKEKDRLWRIRPLV
ncbi:hypothetical protein MRX96_008798 [Rhipicephalus microplus]